MTIKEIQELIKIINKSTLSEFKMKDGEFELSIRTEKYHSAKRDASTPVVLPQQPLVSLPPQMPAQAPAAPVAPAAPAAPAPAASAEAGKTKEAATNYLEIKSPMVGTFYRSQSPDKPAFIKVGDVVEVGQTVCIVEAMKLFNEIESEIGGKVVKVLVEDAQPVEYDQVLFLVEPV